MFWWPSPFARHDDIGPNSLRYVVSRPSAWLSKSNVFDCSACFGFAMYAGTSCARVQCFAVARSWITIQTALSSELKNIIVATGSKVNILYYYNIKVSNFIFIDFWNREEFSGLRRVQIFDFDVIDVKNAIYMFVYIHLFSYIFSVWPSILTLLTSKHYLYVYIHAPFFDQIINSKSNSYAIDVFLGCTVYIYMLLFFVRFSILYAIDVYFLYRMIACIIIFC